MNRVVRLTRNDDGDYIAREDQEWCATGFFDTDRTLCGWPLDGDSALKFENRSVKRGGVTCDKCMMIIMDIKAFRL